MGSTAHAPSYARHNRAPRPYIPPPQSPTPPWREDPLGAIALFVTMAVLIAAVGVASLV